ncbi:MAG: hypothetical protein IKN59_06180 [Paludibacteraceae bacterium]|nr:hypothetical protein [Paludibacteraceae bacterium]
MKRMILPLLIAALMGFTACQNEVNFVKKDYLPAIHSAVNTTRPQMEKVMKTNKFVYNESKSKTDAPVYELISKDSTLQLSVVYKIANDTVKTYTATATINGAANGKQADALYADWSRYAYNTIFGEISLWGGYTETGNEWSIGEIDEETEEEYGMDYKMYIDGGWAPMIKLMMEAYHTSGEMDDEMYATVIEAFKNKRTVFEQVLNENGFVDAYCPDEAFFHSTSTLDMSSLSSGLQSLQGASGMLYSGSDEDNPLMRLIHFRYNGNIGLEDFMEQIL